MGKFLPFIISFLVSLIGMPPIIWCANKNGIVDKPNGRKVHKKPTPLLGGTAIFIGFTVTFIIFAGFSLKVVSIVFCSAILVILGFLDDVYDIGAKKKLVIQILCSIIVVASGIRVNISEYITQNLYFSLLIDASISICWIVGIINAINLIDGLDGLAGGVSLIASVGFIFLLGKRGSDHIGFLIALSIAGSILGFLFYNFHPAKIFMGDMGSTFIGFILAILGIISLNIPENPASMVAPIIILAVPIFDTGLAIVRRAINKQPLLVADKQHLHHRIMGKGFSQKQTVLIIYGFALLAALIGITIGIFQYFYLGLVVVLFLILFGLMLNMDKYIKNKKTEQTKYNFKIMFTKKEGYINK